MKDRKLSRRDFLFSEVPKAMTAAGLLLAGCSALPVEAPAAVPAAPEAAVPKVMPGVPPEAIGFIQETLKTGEALPGYHGTSAWTLLAGDIVKQAQFTQEEAPIQQAILSRTNGLYSFNRMMEDPYWQLIFGRNTTGIPKGYKNPINGAENAYKLWLGAQRPELGDKQPLGAPYATAQEYATRMITTRGFSSQISQDVLTKMHGEIEFLQKVVDTNQATPAQQIALKQLETDYSFLVNRQTLFDRINESSQADLMNQALKTPIILEGKIPNSEVGVNSNEATSGFAYVKSGEMPFSKFSKAYLPKGASQAVIDRIKALYPDMQVVVDEGFDAIKTMPTATYKMLWGAAGAFNTVVEYLPIIGGVTMVATAAGVVGTDIYSAASRHEEDAKAGRTNMDLWEYYKWASDWKNQLLIAGSDGMGNSLFTPIVDLANANEAVNEPNRWEFRTVNPGETVTIPMVFKDGTKVYTVLADKGVKFLGMDPKLATIIEVDGDQKFAEPQFTFKEVNGEKKIVVTNPDGTPAVVGKSGAMGDYVLFDMLPTNDERLKSLNVEVRPVCEYRYIVLTDGRVVIGTHTDAVAFPVKK